MKPCKIGNVAAEYDEEPLVKVPTREYPDGYGGHIQFETARDLRKVLKANMSQLDFLAKQVGVLKLTTESADFNMRGLLTGSSLKDRPRWTLPLHVDLKGDVPEEIQKKYRYATAFVPEYWSSRPQVLWQNATPKGRPASTVWVPPSIANEALLDLLTTPTATLVDAKFLEEDEIWLWDRLCGLAFLGLNRIGEDATAQLMVFKDLNNMVHEWKGAVKQRYLSLFDRTNERVLTEVEPWSLEMNWQSPEALGGVVCLFANDENKLFHTRRNRGKHMGRPTVMGA